MNKFIPETETINADRNYFINNNTFIKIDQNIKRGENEARTLSQLRHPYIQRYISSQSKASSHSLETEYFNGKTLENISFSWEDICRIESQLFEMLSYTISKQVVHGDINVSNILYNGEKILVIDWETSYTGDALNDLFGPPTPTDHCGIVNVIKTIRAKIK